MKLILNEKWVDEPTYRSLGWKKGNKKIAIILKVGSLGVTSWLVEFLKFPIRNGGLSFRGEISAGRERQGKEEKWIYSCE